MSHIDEKIKGEAWDSSVTIMFELTPSEVTTHTPPRPYYVSMPRLGYFAFVCEELEQHFGQSAVESAKGEIWLEYNNQPVRWHLPVGVLHDTLNTKCVVPWRLTVHFRNFPLSLLHCGSLDKMETVFMNSLKEALFLRHGSSKAMNALSKEDQQQLFVGVKEKSYRKFWQVNQTLLDYETTHEVCKYVPIRFIFRNLQQPCVQKPIPPFDEEEKEHTLRSCLNVLIPQLINSQQMQLNSAESDSEDTGVKCSVHGVPVSLDTPLVWLINHCAHADNFVYVVASVSPTAFVECLSGTFA